MCACVHMCACVCVGVCGWIGVHESVGKGSGGCIGVYVGRVGVGGGCTHMYNTTGRTSRDHVPKWAWYKLQ